MRAHDPADQPFRQCLICQEKKDEKKEKSKDDEDDYEYEDDDDEVGTY